MSYATQADVTEFTGETSLPDNIERLLLRAEEIIDTVTLDQIQSDKTIHMEAAKKATCAQVEYWLAVGEEEDVEGPVQGYSIGSYQVQYGAGDNRVSPSIVAPRARRYLLKAGLLYRGATSS